MQMLISKKIRCFQMRKRTWFLIPLTLFICLTIKFNDYNHVTRGEIDMVLYKKVHPDVWKGGRPNCTYESILQSTRTVQAWDVPKNYDNFDAHGILDGAYSPDHCNPLFSVAIIITYRNRQQHLNIILPYIHNFLRKQNIHYKIYLVEQQDNKPWNKGLLYNLGAKQAMTDGFPCLILHDVDLIPLDDANLYVCTTSPRHLSASIDKFRFVLTYDKLVGGVLAVTADQYSNLNGFSNQFLEWGGEDDDLANRIVDHNFTIIRFPREMARYTMLLHRPHVRNAVRRGVLREHARRGTSAAAADGLRAPVYSSLRVQNHRLFTLVKVKT